MGVLIIYRNTPRFWEYFGVTWPAFTRALPASGPRYEVGVIYMLFYNMFSIEFMLIFARVTVIEIIVILYDEQNVH
jgi:hypothetical protein